MSVLGTVNVIESALWPQRDARDPLGIFGWRVSQAGDASSGSNKIVVEVAEALRHAYVYKIYDMIIAQTVGITTTSAKMRILSNWPNVDPDPGIQAYAALWVGIINGATLFTAPRAGFFDTNPFAGNSKEILIYDPSTRIGAMQIAEQEVVNTDVTTYSFEGYGYYWDRSVMGTPGGPRNPGTS